LPTRFKNVEARTVHSLPSFLSPPSSTSLPPQSPSFLVLEDAQVGIEQRLCFVVKSGFRRNWQQQPRPSRAQLSFLPPSSTRLSTTLLLLRVYRTLVLNGTSFGIRPQETRSRSSSATSRSEIDPSSFPPEHMPPFVDSPSAPHRHSLYIISRQSFSSLSPRHLLPSNIETTRSRRSLLL